MNEADERAFDSLGGSEWDAVVVGAGPAGSIAAREMARRGASVLLVEKAKFPRYKVCGCCLNGRALYVLADAGLEQLTQRIGGVPLGRFELAAGGKRARIALPGGAAVSRAAFDNALADAAVDEGACFIPESRARLLEGTEKCWRIGLRGYDRSIEVCARVVLAADGLAQKLLSDVANFDADAEDSAYIGAGVMLKDGPSDYAPGVIYMAHGAGGYVGLVRVEDGRLNVAAALNTAALRDRGGLGAVCANLLQDAGLKPLEDVEHADWRGTPRLTRRASRLSAHRVLVLGDAAGYVEPFTGEGMAWALSGGRAAAAIGCAGLDRFDERLEKAWARQHHALTGRAHWRCRLISSALRRPRLIQMSTWVLNKLPALASPVIQGLNSTPTIEREVL